MKNNPAVYKTVVLSTGDAARTSAQCHQRCTITHTPQPFYILSKQLQMYNPYNTKLIYIIILFSVTG